MVQKKLGDYGKKSPAKSPAKTISGKKVATRKEIRKHEGSTEIPKRGPNYTVRVRSHWRR